jgi:hypothetical protein
VQRIKTLFDKATFSEMYVTLYRDAIGSIYSSSCMCCAPTSATGPIYYIVRLSVSFLAQNLADAEFKYIRWENTQSYYVDFLGYLTLQKEERHVPGYT